MFKTAMAYIVFLLLLLDSVMVSALCKGDHYTIKHHNGSEQCFPCLNCPKGYGLDPPCGSTLRDAPSLECKACEPGQTYSPDNGIYSCKACALCSQHEEVIRSCTQESNSKCSGHCDKRFYYEEETGDCQPCSFCCFDDYDDIIRECKNSGMPAYKQCSETQNYRCSPKCRKDQYMLVNNITKPVCIDCPTCPTGTGLFKKCGSIIEDRSMIKCQPCSNGTTFSDKAAAAQCKKCSTCTSKGVTKECSPTADTQCGDCLSGYYKENSTDRCIQCSYCCEDDIDVRVDECVQQGMPAKRQCLYTKRSVTTCHRIIAKSSDNKRLALIIVPSVLVIIMISIALIYTLIVIKRRRKGYSKMSCPDIPDVEQASVASQSTDVEWAVISSATKSITFTKSGVKVEFADLESYEELSRNLAVEICWGEVNYPVLEEGEILLSPVVKFHPHNKILTEKVCVKIPHSASLVEPHHSELKVKCGVFQENRFAWQDMPESEFTTDATEVCFHTNKLQAYTVVGRSGANRKRMQCALFVEKELKDGRFTADLCFIDDCEASEKRIAQEEDGKGKKYHGRRFLEVSVIDEENVNIEVQEISEGWSLIDIKPKALKGETFVNSYKSIPRCEITFYRSVITKEDFQCTIIASNQHSRAVLPVIAYFEKELNEKKKDEEVTPQTEFFNLRVSELPPEIWSKIQELMDEKDDVDQKTLKVGIQEVGREYTGGMQATYLNMTVGELISLKKTDRPRIVEEMRLILYQSTEV